MTNHDKKYIYTKISKNASSTITAILRAFSDDNTEHFGHFTTLDEIRILESKDEDPKDYFKFTFVRNPWSRCVSHYFYQLKKQNTAARRAGVENLGAYSRESTFKEYIKSKTKKFHLGVEWVPNPAKNLTRILKKHQPLEHQLDWIVDEQENLLVDYIGKIENFQTDLNVVGKKIGMPPQEIPVKNKSGHKHYTEYYDDETREIVAQKYARDIEYFGYKFGE